LDASPFSIGLFVGSFVCFLEEQMVGSLMILEADLAPETYRVGVLVQDGEEILHRDQIVVFASVGHDGSRFSGKRI